MVGSIVTNTRDCNRSAKSYGPISGFLCKIFRIALSRVGEGGRIGVDRYGAYGSLLCFCSFRQSSTRKPSASKREVADGETAS